MHTPSFIQCRWASCSSCLLPACVGETCAVPLSEACLEEIYGMLLGLGRHLLLQSGPNHQPRCPPCSCKLCSSASLPFYCPCHIQHLRLLSLCCVSGLSPCGDLPHMALVWKSLPTASLHSIMIMFYWCYPWRSACSGLLSGFTCLLSD